MKKLLVVLMALLFTTGAFAQNTGAKFDYSLFGLAYGAMGSYGSGEKWDYQHIRLRPMFTAGNENIKGVVELEIDQTYGANDNAGGGISERSNAITEVRQAYLQANNVFIQGLGFTTGIVGYVYPLIADIEGAVTAASFDFGMGVANLYYLKIWEGDYLSKDTSGKTKDDAQAYILDVSIKAGDINIRPALFYATVEKGIGVTNAKYTDLKAYMGAVNATGDMGMFDFDLTAAFLSAKNDAALAPDKIDGSAYAFDLGVNVKPAPNMAIGIFGTYSSGVKDGKEKKFGFNEAMDMLFVNNAGSTGFDSAEGVPAGRLYLLQQGGTHDAGGNYPSDMKYGSRIEQYGIMAAGLSFTYTMDKLTCFAQYGYVMSAKEKRDPVTGKKGDGIGSEIDVKVSYEIAPKTDLFLEYAYVMQGDDIFLKDDAQQILWGLMTQI